MSRTIKLVNHYDPTADACLYNGDCLDFLSQIPDGAAQLIITSPPYNLGKEYEVRVSLDQYLEQQAKVIEACVEKLADGGSICWEVGNYVRGGEIWPLDIMLFPLFTRFGLHLRNRVIWHFEHGLHATRRLSGRHESILWFTKGEGEYHFNLDPIRVPVKYPEKKHYKGPKRGQLSSNPLGKNPGDVWIFPNVKANHPEKTIHPCQFPVELAERFVLAVTKEGDLVLDPYVGVGTAVVAAILHGRRGAGSDIIPEYIKIARKRVLAAAAGTLPVRPMTRPVYQPGGAKK